MSTSEFMSLWIIIFICMIGATFLGSMTNSIYIFDLSFDLFASLIATAIYACVDS